MMWVFLKGDAKPGPRLKQDVDRSKCALALFTSSKVVLISILK